MLFILKKPDVKAQAEKLYLAGEGEIDSLEVLDELLDIIRKRGSNTHVSFHSGGKCFNIESIERLRDGARDCRGDRETSLASVRYLYSAGIFE